MRKKQLVLALSCTVSLICSAQLPPSLQLPGSDLRKLRQDLSAPNQLPATSRTICQELMPKANAELVSENLWRLGAEMQCLRIEHLVGNNRESIDGLEKLLATYVDNVPPASNLPIFVRYYLIEPYKDTGRPDLALKHANTALGLAQANGGKHREFISPIVAELCSLNLATRNFGAAEQQCRVAVQLRKNEPAGDPLRIQARLSLLGVALEARTSSSDKVAADAREILAEIESAPVRRTAQLTLAWVYLSRAYVEAKDFAQAESVLKDAIGQLENGPNKDLGHAESVRRNLAGFYLKTGRIAEAKQVEESFAARPRASDDLKDIVDRANAATSLYLQHNYPAAIAEYEDILRKLDKQRASVNMNAEAKAGYFEKYRLLANYLAMAYAQSGNAEAAFLTLEDAKARTSIEQMLSAETLRSLQGDERKRAESVRQRIATAAGTLALAAPLSAQAAAAERDRFAAQEELDAILASVKPLDGAGAFRPPSRERLKASLERFRNGHVYVTWMTSSSQAVMPLVVRDGTVYTIPKKVVANFADLASTIDVFRQVQMHGEARLAAMGKRLYVMENWTYQLAASAPAGARRLASAQELEQSMSTSLLGWISEHLQGATRVTISPDGPLWLMPFEALKLGQTHLVANADVTYVPSLSWVLAQEQRLLQRPKQDFAQELLAVGAPVFQSAVGAGGTGIGAYDLAALREARGKDSGAFLMTLARLTRSAPELPGSRSEVEAIASLFPKDRVLALLGADASERRMSDLAASGALSQYRRIHIATHGMSSTANPMLSALLLGRTSGRTDEDGYLTAQEIASWTLAADLVVLSACDSATGRIVGGDGVLGLPYAFAIAGARNTVQTLWPIPDQWTSAFMEAFYKRLNAGDSPQTALASAKRGAINAQGRRTLRDGGQPWAAFVVYGM